MLSCGASEVTSEETPDFASLSHIAKDKDSADYARVDDIRLVVGNDTLILVSDACLGGLHNILWTNTDTTCSGVRLLCFSEISAIISKNLEEAYKSCAVKIDGHQYLLNIYIPNRFLKSRIDVFYPIIKRFVDDRIEDNKLGLYSVFTGRGTSADLCDLVNHLEHDGYICCGVGTSITTTAVNATASLLRWAKEWNGFDYIDTEDLAANKEGFHIEDIPSLLYDKVVDVMRGGVAVRAKQGERRSPCSSKAEIIETYGQVRTMADILVSMNELRHFSNSNDAVDAVEEFIKSQEPCHSAISGKAFHFIADALYSPMAFVDGALNRDAFMENFAISQFEKGWDNAMYRYYYAKLWKLVCYFNDFRRYTSPNQIYKDLEKTVTPEYYIMSDSAYREGGYPQYFFRRAIEEAWDEIAPDNSIHPELLDEYMFRNHEMSVRTIGLEATILKYFVRDYCHTDVYFPQKVGTAPVYNERLVGNKRIFSKSCGEGIGPNCYPESLEIRYAYKLLFNSSLKIEIKAKRLSAANQRVL